MRKFTALAASFILFSVTGVETLQADESNSKSVTNDLLYIIYDSSNSMWGQLEDGSRKYEAGRNALVTLLNDPFEGKDLAFRAYGHRDKTDCRDSELIVPPTAALVARSGIEKAVDSIRPTGKTPISWSLRESLKDFGNEAERRKGDILLISDGIETCDMDPCDLMQEWRDSGVSIRVHVVGVGLNALEAAAMSCVAETSGGQYFDAGSESELVSAMNSVSDIRRGEPAPLPDSQGYALKISGVDKEGRSFLIKGMLYQDDQELMSITSNGRYPLEGPGDYVMEVGVLLKDGMIYKRVKQSFSITKKGDHKEQVLITRPAIVSARFTEDGEEHRGSHVSVFQHGKQVFAFRAFDEALAQPGVYEFRTKPNDDNELMVQATLVEGESTIIDFDLIKTVKIYVQFSLPNGKIIKRHSQLFKNGQQVYKLHSSNGGLAKPGVYELHSDDPLVPLAPIEIEVTEDGQIITAELDAGFLSINYEGNEFDFFKKPNRANFAQWDTEASSWDGGHFASTNKQYPVLPQRYRVKGHSNYGFFDPIEVEISTGEFKTVSLKPKPLGAFIVSYKESERYLKTPDRASVSPLDGQAMASGFMRPGVARKFLPGRYSVKGWSSAGDIESIEFVVTAGETTNIELKLKSE